MLLFRRMSDSSATTFAAPSAAAAVPAAAAVTDSGLQTITLTDPTSTQGAFTIASPRLGSISDLSNPGSSVHNYVATTLTATETGNYIFGQTSAPQDTVMVLYNGSFDPAHPGANTITFNDDTSVADHAAVGATVKGCTGPSGSRCPQVSADLTAGQTVTVVLTTYPEDKPLGLPQSIYVRGGLSSRCE